MIRTRAWPAGGIVRSSLSTVRPRLAYLPTPATVRAVPGSTWTFVEITAGELAAAPAPRMLTVYWPV